MRRLLCSGESDHPGQSLQRVERALQILQRDRFGKRGCIDREQYTSQDREMLVALREVVVDELLEEATFRHLQPACSSGRISDTIVAGANGAVRYSVAPSRSAAARQS